MPPTDRAREMNATEANLYRKLVEDAADIVWAADAERRLTYVNRAYERIRGFSRDEALGRHIFSWMAPDAAAEIEARFVAMANDPAVDNFRFELRQLRKDGCEVWTETHTTIERDPSGRALGFHGVSRDISERKHVESQLDASRAALTYERDMLETLLGASPDNIYFKDTKSRIVRMSRSKAAQLVQTVPALRRRHEADPTIDPLQLVAGITDFDTYAAEDAQRAFDDEQRIVASGEPLLNKIEHQVFQDGTDVWFITNKLPWRNQRGEIIGTFGVSKDITNLKQAELELEKITKELVSASRYAGMAEVATGVLHNVGNAVNSVNVAVGVAIDRLRASRVGNITRVVDMLEANRDNLVAFLASDDRAHKFAEYVKVLASSIADERDALLQELDEVRRHVDHIKEIVSMQQAYATTAGAIERVPLHEVVEDAIRMNAGALTRHGVVLVRSYGEDLSVSTDRHKVLQILVNLLRNAKYACDESGRTDKRIEVRIARASDGAAIEIADNGVGIASENLQKIFRHGFTTRKGGHGFGLHSGANAARELGGALTVASAGVGAGATFRLTIPLERAPAESADGAPNDHAVR